MTEATGGRTGGVVPWIWVTLAALAVLSGVDAWRERGPSAVPLVQGTLPNLVAVPALTFGFLMMRAPTRRRRTPEARRLQRRWFWALWGLSIVGVVAWEFLQRTGALVFDPLDLVATALGAAGAVLLFRILEPRSWARPRNGGEGTEDAEDRRRGRHAPGAPRTRADRDAAGGSWPRDAGRGGG